ncbi:unnamed protein product, partial [marine sediment metagenome]
IEDIADKAAKKESQTELNRARVSPSLSLEAKIFMMSRLGIPCDRIARDIATSDPECKWTEEALAQRLGVIRQTVNTWISDIRARQRAGRDIIIIR